MSTNLEVTVVAHDIGPVGGMERQLSVLIRGLLKRGHAVTVISRTCELPPHDHMRWVRVPGPSRPFPLAYPWFFLIGSLLVRRHSRGVVHSTGAIVFNRVALSTVHFCHHAVAGLPQFSRASRSGFLYGLNERVGRFMSRVAESICYRPGRTAELIAVSGGVARELTQHFPKMRQRIEVIPNGVDVETFRPGENGDGEDDAGTVRAVFVGSEWERKGLRMAVEAVADSDGIELTVVGSGDVDSYGDLARRLGAEDRIHFAGPTEDVAPWYREAGVFLLPTAYEAAPLVSYEAAASGLPLLVTRVNGVEDLLEDGVNGWFIERDATDIRRRLLELKADPRLRAQMAAAAREDSLRFSWDRVVDRYAELYNALSRWPDN
jgi:glycosyltransferase involved in cell wall biosynthesis